MIIKTFIMSPKVDSKSFMNTSKWQENSCLSAHKRKYTTSVMFPLSQGRYYVRRYINYFISLLFNPNIFFLPMLLFKHPVICSQSIIYIYVISGRSEHQPMEQNIIHTFVFFDHQFLPFLF